MRGGKSPAWRLRNSVPLQVALPAVCPYRYYVAQGGLLCYGVNNVDLCRQAAPYLDRILRGAKPADLPIQQLPSFELVINMKPAKALGITNPQSLLLARERDNSVTTRQRVIVPT